MREIKEQIGGTHYKIAIEDLEKAKDFDLLHKIYDDFEDKNTLKDYKFTNCNDCTNKVDNKFTEVCYICKRYYGCHFERKE